VTAASITPPPGIVVMNDADHTYTIDGKPAPGVTSIIKEAGLADWRWVKDFYRDRGSRAHKAMHFMLDSDLDLGSCPDDVVGYVISAEDFLLRHNARTISAERRVRSLNFWYAGTLDWIGLMDSCDDRRCCPVPFRDAVTLLDWKTSLRFHPATAIQLVAYGDAWFEETKQLPQRRICVLVAEDGGQAQQKEYPPTTLRADRETLRAALTCCAWRRRNNVASIYDDESAAA